MEEQKKSEKEKKHQESASTIIFPFLTEEIPKTPVITGHSFKSGVDYNAVLESYYTSGC